MSNKPRWFGGKPKDFIVSFSSAKNELFTPFWATSQLWTIRKYGLIMPTSSSWPNKLQKKCDFYELSLILISQIAIKKFAYSKNPARSVWVLFNESSGSCAGEKWFVEFTWVSLSVILTTVSFSRSSTITLAMLRRPHVT